MKFLSFLFGALIVIGLSSPAAAVSSAELYTNQSYQYGRFAARIQFAPASGVVSSFFLWKDGSEVAGTFWNELDFEKLEGECRVESNAIFGEPEQITPQRHEVEGELCAEYHTYVYEWTPDYIAWFIDDREVRRETGEVAAAFREHGASGMQLRFNVWPGDATFGGAFDPGVLPVYQYIDWVEYSSYADGAFELQWREEFDAGSVPAGWSLGTWESPKNLSTHVTTNVGIRDGVAVLALTADDARGIDGAMLPTSSGTPPTSPGTPPEAGVNPSPDAPGSATGAPASPPPTGDAPTTPAVPGEQPAPQPGSPPAAGDDAAGDDAAGDDAAGDDAAGDDAAGDDPAPPGAAGSFGEAPIASAGALGAEPGEPEGCGCRLSGFGSTSTPPLALAWLLGVAWWARLGSRRRTPSGFR